MNSSWNTLIDPDELFSQLEHTDLVIIDCRFSLADSESGRNQFSDNHIPGARYAHLEDDLSGTIVAGSTGRHPLPSSSAAQNVFRDLGVNNHSQVVTYDDFGGAFAARAWWMLHWLGHDHVAVLNGGWPAWIEAGYPQDSSPGKTEPGAFVCNPRPDLLISSLQIDSVAQDPGRLLIDARSHERFLGIGETMDPVAGHIPGARSCYFGDNLESSGSFLKKNVLRARWKELLQSFPASDVVSYCGSGVTGAHNVLAIRYAGLGDVPLYVGSWSEWITRRERAVATGPENDHD